MTTAAERRAIISAEVPLEHKRKLEQLAAEGDRSLSHEIRRAVREHLQLETGDAQDDADRGGVECAANRMVKPFLSIAEACHPRSDFSLPGSGLTTIEERVT